MDDEQLDDLKQFIDGRISQSEARLDNRIDGLEQRFDSLEQKFDGLEQRFNGLEQKVDDGFAGIADALEASQTETDQRLTKLEEQTAA